MTFHDILPPLEGDRPAPPPPPPPASESAWRLLAVALGWVVLAAASALTAGVIVGLVKTAFVLQNTPAFRLVVFTLAAFSFGIVLLAGAIVRGRIIGGGDVWRGLGVAPIARLPIIIVLAITVVAYAVLRDYAIFKIRPDLFFQFSSVAPWIALLDVLVTVLLAPVAEELFFRGWLWTGLRQHWDALPTALLTAVFWLVLHLDRGFALLAALVPMALILTLARQVGKSVRATIPLHAIYNLAVNIPIILIVFGLHQGNGTQATVAPAPVTNSVAPSPPATVVSRDIFTGSESRIAAMNYINPDSTAGAAPIVRVVVPAPANGAVRFEQITMPIARPKTDSLAGCNGKPMTATVVFYKSNEGFTGTDTVILDVDFRHGSVHRFIYNLTIR